MMSTDIAVNIAKLQWTEYVVRSDLGRRDKAVSTPISYIL